MWDKSILCSMFIRRTQSRSQTTQNKKIFLFWTYLNSGAWYSKACISIFFALSIVTRKTLSFESYLPKKFDWYNLSHKYFSLVMKSVLIQLLPREKYLLNISIRPSNLNFGIFRFESDCFPLVIYFFIVWLVFLFSFLFFDVFL